MHNSETRGLIHFRQNRIRIYVIFGVGTQTALNLLVPKPTRSDTLHLCITPNQKHLQQIYLCKNQTSDICIFNFANISITTDMDIFSSVIYPRNVLCIFTKTAIVARIGFTRCLLEGSDQNSISKLRHVTHSRPPLS